jgi:RNA recognition motif-containing protein
MDSEAAGNKAVKELNGKFLAGMKIRVQRSTSFPIGKAAGTQEVGCFKLYLTHLNDGVTKEFVTGLLEKFGRIVEIEIYKNNSAFVVSIFKIIGKLHRATPQSANTETLAFVYILAHGRGICCQECY